MTTPEKQEIIIVGMTTARLRVPPVPSNRENCLDCGAEVWVDVTVRHDGCLCIECALPQAEKIDFAPLADVAATLRRHGMTDAEIERASEYAEAMLRGPRREG
jgi:hypothetical protein